MPSSIFKLCDPGSIIDCFCSPPLSIGEHYSTSSQYSGKLPLWREHLETTSVRFYSKQQALFHLSMRLYFICLMLFIVTWRLISLMLGHFMPLWGACNWHFYHSPHSLRNLTLTMTSPSSHLAPSPPPISST
jgi:hypothetical protein